MKERLASKQTAAKKVPKKSKKEIEKEKAKVSRKGVRLQTKTPEQLQELHKFYQNNREWTKC